MIPTLPRIPNYERAEHFRKLLTGVAVGMVVVVRLDTAPPDNTMRYVADQLGMHIAKIRVPRANRIIVVRKS